MSTKEALQAYHQMAQRVFSKSNHKKRWGPGEAYFNASTLIDVIREIVEVRNSGQYLLQDIQDTEKAKTFVAATPSEVMVTPRLFRTYPVRENAGTDCKIWEVARATNAASTFFKGITIKDDWRGREQFTDGGLLCNNPSEIALHEALKAFNPDTKLECLVSIGTGISDMIGLGEPNALQKILPTNLITVLKNLATVCEQTAFRLTSQFSRSLERYFRFSASRGVGKISLDECEKMSDITSYTIEYLGQPSVSTSIDNLVGILCQTNLAPQRGLTLKSICQF